MWWILLIIVVIPVLFLWLTYNSLVELENTVEVAWSQIDVQLQRRHDLIPKLVKVTQEYIDYEREVINNLVEARREAVQSQQIDSQAGAESDLNQALDKLLGVVEDYPDLKAKENFLELHEELVSTENKIAFGRQSYNDAVLYFNNQVETFPSNLIADYFGFETEDYFEIEYQRERKAPDLGL
ncbi:MAG: LemA family protein [Bacillota bacterium]